MAIVLTSGERHDMMAIAQLLSSAQVKRIGAGRPVLQISLSPSR